MLIFALSKIFVQLLNSNLFLKNEDACFVLKVLECDIFDRF